MFNIILIIPFILKFTFLQEYTHTYNRGIDSPEIYDFGNYIVNLFSQIYFSFKSVISGLIPYSNNLYFWIFIITFILLFIKFIIKEKNNINRTIFFCCLIYFLQWILLYSLNLIPLDQTRHSLIFFPVLLTIFYLILPKIKKFNLIYMLLLITLVPLSVGTSKLKINEKLTLFNYKFLDNLTEKTILLYDSTQALAYFENSDKSVYFIPLSQFKKNYLKLNIPNNFLLVGHHSPFSEWETYFKDNFPNLYNDFKITKLREISTEINLLYNNYDTQENPPNGFFVYKFNKRI